MASTKKTKTRRQSSTAKSGRATAGKRTTQAGGAAARRARTAKPAAKSSAKAGKSPVKKRRSPAKKGKSADPSPKRPKQPAPQAAEQDLPEFAVAFIDGEGQAHVAVAAAPDPAAALAELLEQAAMFEESFLDDLVAVMVTHPTTWDSVKKKVVGVFSE